MRTASYARRPFRRTTPRYYPKRNYTRSYGQNRSPAVRRRYFGKKAAQYVKSRRGKLLTTSYYGNFLPWWNDQAANPPVLASPNAQWVWLGQNFAPDAAGNPTNNGDGLLYQVNLRDNIIDYRNRRYSAMTVSAAGITNSWARLNPNIDIKNVFVKGVKVTCVSRDTTQTDMFFVMTRRSTQTPLKFRESLTKTKAYFKTAKLDPVADAAAIANGTVRWKLDDNWIGGPVGARIKVKLYYKIKYSNLAVN